ncbi:alpha/beta hydrolase [Streptomyces sp. NPDC003016]
MTAFILVSGAFTGAHVWEGAAARLAAAGAEVHTPDLTGLGAGRGPARPGTDLETHIADVLAAIDSVGGAAGREIVLVGHDYGIHPVLGAADRRAERVSRIVYLDAGMPQDGVPALAAVPDQALREQLAGRAARGAAAGELPPPARDEWQRWGSTAGVPEEALDRLTARAAPQPLGTLLQPLRLTGAVAAVPATGVLCTGNGAGIEMLRLRVSFGGPAFEALTDPRVTFFELPTGHWPMLSCPAELAEVLLRAAAGEGHRLKPAGTTEPPPHLRPFLLDLPEPARERSGNVDLYLPAAEGPRPAVVFVHGGPVPAGARPTPREWPAMTGYARYAAGQGAVGVTFDHRLHDVTDYERAAADTAAAVELVRADPRVDPDRVALWFFSGGGPMAADWLGAPPAWLRCLAASYPILAPLPDRGSAEGRFRPAAAVADAGGLPLVLTRVGFEVPEIAATVAEFLAAAEDCGADVEVIDVPNGHHNFEALDPTDESREAVHRAMRSVLAHLTG